MFKRFCLHREHGFVRFGFVLCCLLLLFSIYQLHNQNYAQMVQEAPNSGQVSSEGEDTACQSIHIAMVMAGYTAPRFAVTALKSVLMHRKGPIHLHLLVTPNSHRILLTLFNTWGLPHVLVTFYEAESSYNSVIWVRNSKKWPRLLKLVLPTILSSVDRVIVLDTDLVVMTDIEELWQQFSKFNSTQSIGMAYNIGPYYLKNKRWPVIGRGFNSGVTLMWVSRLRSWGWSKKWKSLVRQCLVKSGKPLLDDQDILNTIVQRHRHLLFHLSCLWNMQVHKGAMHQLCYNGSENPKQVKLIHWAGDTKHWSSRMCKFGQYFHKMYMKYLTSDGNVLRHQQLDCPSEHQQPQESLTDISNDECFDMRVEHLIVRRTHLFYMDFNYKSDGRDDDVTLVSELSVDKMHRLETLARQWDGPMSLCVYVTDTEAHQLAKFVLSSKVLRSRKNIGFHLVIKEGEFYPKNQLLNVALENAPTDHVLLFDFDFVPIVGLYKQLRVELARNARSAENVALVLPAFETFQHNLRIPTSKKELLSRLQLGEFVNFHRQQFKANGFVTTNLIHWESAEEPFPVEWHSICESCLVVKRTSVTFNRKLVGSHDDSLAVQLDIRGFKFMLLPNSFVVHLPQVKNMDSIIIRSSSEYIKCISRIKNEYIRQLAKNYSISVDKYFV